MFVYDPEGTHEKYTQAPRHWNPESELYTGADSLITAQRQGWRLVKLAYREDRSLGHGRFSTIYHFKLVRGGQSIIMSITNNPFVQKMLQHKNITVHAHPSRTRQDTGASAARAVAVANSA